MGYVRARVRVRVRVRVTSPNLVLAEPPAGAREVPPLGLLSRGGVATARLGRLRLRLRVRVRVRVRMRVRGPRAWRVREPSEQMRPRLLSTWLGLGLGLG